MPMTIQRQEPASQAWRGLGELRTTAPGRCGDREPKVSEKLYRSGSGKGQRERVAVSPPDQAGRPNLKISNPISRSSTGWNLPAPKCEGR
jgi:hypothetical protein